jgi:hypothetical protein
MVGLVVNGSPILKARPEYVTHVGRVPQVKLSGYSAASDVFVLQSLAQGLASELPVIITPETGYDAVARDGKEGFVVPSRNARAIADRWRCYQEMLPLEIGSGKLPDVALKTIRGAGSSSGLWISWRRACPTFSVHTRAMGAQWLHSAAERCTG